MAGAQGLTGALIGTVTDAQGGVLSGAVVRISSTALIGGELTTKTDQRGELRFPSVPPGSYALDIVLQGFRPYRDPEIYIGAGATIERTPVLTLAALAWPAPRTPRSLRGRRSESPMQDFGLQLRDDLREVGCVQQPLEQGL
jgi:carboxypeptidase family protein